MTGSRFSALFFAAAVLTIPWPPASAMECYECRSEVEQCRDGKVRGISTENLGVCELAAQCWKEKKVAQDGTEITERGCLLVASNKDGCHTEIGEEETTITRCYCSTHRCNSATRMQGGGPGIGSLPLAFLPALVLATLLRGLV